MDRHCHSNTLGYSKSKMVDTTVVFQSLGREKKIKEIMKLIRHGAFGLIPHLISPDYAEGGGELSFQTSYTLRWPGEVQFLYVPNTDPTAYWTALVDQCSWRVEGGMVTHWASSCPFRSWCGDNCLRRSCFHSHTQVSKGPSPAQWESGRLRVCLSTLTVFKLYCELRLSSVTNLKSHLLLVSLHIWWGCANATTTSHWPFKTKTECSSFANCRTPSPDSTAQKKPATQGKVQPHYSIHPASWWKCDRGNWDWVSWRNKSQVRLKHPTP